MFKKAISWLLILALLCSGTVLSVFAAEETAEHDFMWTAADGSTGYGDFNHGSDTEDTSLRSNFGVPAGGTVTLLRNVTLRKRIRLYENPIAVLDGNGFTITGASFDVSHVALSMTIKNVTFDFTAEAENGYFNKFLQINSAEQSLVFENCRFDIKGEPGAAVFVQRGNLTLKDCSFRYTTDSAKSVFLHETAGRGVTVIRTTFDLADAGNAAVGLSFGLNDYYCTQSSFSAVYEMAKAGDTISMLADWTVNNESERLILDKAVTLDGNGYTLSAEMTTYLLRVDAAGVKLRNLNLDQSGAGAAMQINAGASATLENTMVRCTNRTPYAAVVLRGAMVLDAGSKVLAGDTEKLANGFYMDQPQGSLTVNRGAEINVSGKLYGTKHDSAAAVINGGTFTVGGRLLYRDPTADEFRNHDATLCLPSGNVATKNNSGIRFTTVVDREWLNTIREAGAVVVKTGTLIAPKAFVDAAGAFTPEALEAAGKLCLDIENNGWYNGEYDDDFYFYYGNMVKLYAESISSEIAGIGYMVVTVEGLGTFTVYGTQKSGIVSNLADEMTGNDDRQREILAFYRGRTDILEYLGTPDAIYPNGDGSILRSYQGKNVEELNTLCRMLATQGWECVSRYAESGSEFATYKKGNELYHIYIPADRAGCLRVAYSDHANLPQEPETTTGSYETVVVQLNLPLTDLNGYSNGMGYVVRLADGTFLVFDGGYAEQADQLWQTLVKLHGCEDGIVIRAWCLTHAHGDHYGILDQFSRTYASRLTLERFVAAPVDASDASDPFFNNSLPKVLARFEGAVLTVPHTGMVIRFCNLTLEILLTPDEHLIDGKPADFDFNSSGTVYRLSGDGDSMLFLGDAMNDVTTRLMTFWGDSLRANMVQVAHHGVGNSPAAFYEFLNPTVLFYPAGHLLYYGYNGDFGKSKSFANNWNRNGAVRKALEESGKYEILLHDEHAYLRVWGSKGSAQIFTVG